MGNRYRRKYKRIDEEDYPDRNSDDGATTQTAIGEFQSGDGPESEQQASAVGAAAAAIQSNISDPVRSAVQNALDKAPTNGYTTSSGLSVLTRDREKAIEEAEEAVAEAESRGFGESGHESVEETVQQTLSESGDVSESDREAIQDDMEKLTAGQRYAARYGSQGQQGGTAGGAGGVEGAGAGGGGASDVGDAGASSARAQMSDGAGGSGGGDSTGLSHDNPLDGVDEGSAESIQQTRFEASTTEDARDAKDVFRASAGRMSQQATDPQVSQDMFDHLGKGVRDDDSAPSLYSVAGYSQDEASMNFPSETNWQIASHEYGHLLADTYGYNDGEKGSLATAAYAERVGENPDADPFIQVDPEHPEARLSQHNGEFVDDVPENVERFIESANEGWARTQRANRDPDADHEDYTVDRNYSATSAHEFVAVTSEYMQSDTPPDDDSFIKNQPDVVWNYTQVFEPSDTMKGHMNEMHHDEDTDDPFPNAPFPDHDG